MIRECAHATVREPLTTLLSRPGYALHPDGRCRAGMLALAAHESVSGESPGYSGLWGAAAVELQMEAAYVFDHVADSPFYDGRSEDLALAIGLLEAGSAAAVRAVPPTPDAARALRHFFISYSEACGGQFLDGMLQRRRAASLEEALRATSMKAGGLGKLAAGFGARLSGVDEERARLFDRFGDAAFTFAQLVDDMRDAYSGPSSDLSQGKATLPVIFFGQEPGSQDAHDDMLTTGLRSRFETSGAPLFAAILAQSFMNRARETLSLLARVGYGVQGLARFLQSLDSSSAKTLSLARQRLVA